MHSHPILVVEDNWFIRTELCDFLRDRGFNVTAASTAHEAFQALDRAGPLAALVTDINLGVGVNGYDVARYARRARPHLAVLYVSSTAARQHAVEGVMGSAFVSKPFDSEQVADALTRTIHLEAA